MATITKVVWRAVSDGRTLACVECDDGRVYLAHGAHFRIRAGEDLPRHGPRSSNPFGALFYVGPLDHDGYYWACRRAIHEAERCGLTALAASLHRAIHAHEVPAACPRGPFPVVTDVVYATPVFGRGADRFSFQVVGLRDDRGYLESIGKRYGEPVQEGLGVVVGNRHVVPGERVPILAFEPWPKAIGPMTARTALDGIREMVGDSFASRHPEVRRCLARVADDLRSGAIKAAILKLDQRIAGRITSRKAIAAEKQARRALAAEAARSSAARAAARQIGQQIKAGEPIGREIVREIRWLARIDERHSSALVRTDGGWRIAIADYPIELGGPIQDPITFDDMCERSEDSLGASLSVSVASVTEFLEASIALANATTTMVVSGVVSTDYGRQIVRALDEHKLSDADFATKEPEPAAKESSGDGQPPFVAEVYQDLKLGGVTMAIVRSSAGGVACVSGTGLQVGVGSIIPELSTTVAKPEAIATGTLRPCSHVFPDYGAYSRWVDESTSACIRRMRDLSDPLQLDAALGFALRLRGGRISEQAFAAASAPVE